MPSLIVTPGGITSNSYSSLAEAALYHETVLNADVWNDATEDNQIISLIMATRLLDDEVDWSGYMTSLTQALRWPRSGVLNRDGQIYFDQATIPAFLKRATAEFGRLLLAEDRTEERGYGISSVDADTVSVVFDKHDVKPVFPPRVTAMIAQYGIVKGPGSMTVPLVRV